MPSPASPYLVRPSLSVALVTPVALRVGNGLRVVFRPSPAFQLQSILLCLLATMAGVLLLLHPSAFNTFPIANVPKHGSASPVQSAVVTLPVAGLTTSSSSFAYGAVLGHIQIARLHMAAVVREGADQNILQSAVGHIPTTGVAEQSGNFALAAHRETFFSSLRSVRPGDSIAYSGARETYYYRVFSTRIVKETDTSVLKSDGGFAPKTSLAGRERKPRLLTLITCYPFARSEKVTERFIVQADLQSVEPGVLTSKPLPASEGIRQRKHQLSSAARASKAKASKTMLTAHRKNATGRMVHITTFLLAK